MEVLGSPMRVGQKRRRSSEPIGEVERQGHEYYLRPSLDSLEAAFPPRHWSELQAAPFEHNLSHLESSTVAICFEFDMPIFQLFINFLFHQLLDFQVLGYASLSRAMFVGMRHDYHRLKEDRDEVVKAAARY